MLETTNQKVNRLFKPDTQQKLKEHGLMVIDRDDFEVIMEGYYEARRLRIENRKLKAERSDQRGQSVGT